MKKLSETELQDARIQILMDLRQGDRQAARQSYVKLVGLISSPWAISQGRIVEGTKGIQHWLNVVIVLNRFLYLLGLCALLAGILVGPMHFLWVLLVVTLWWVLNKIQLRLNVELAARLVVLEGYMRTMGMATIDLIDAIRESLRAITNPRFYETERGYQAELSAEIRARLPNIQEIDEDAIIEQEFQKRLSAHGLRIRPDLIIHVPFDSESNPDRQSGNFACFELKRRATAAEARGDFDNLCRLMMALRYPIGVFVNIDSADIHESEIPQNNVGQLYSFAVSLKNGSVQVREKHT